MKKIKIFFILLTFSFFNSNIFAETITFSADSMNGSSAKNSDFTKLEGNAKIKTDSMEISADLIELSGKDFRYINAQGNVQGNNTENKMEFSCGKMTYDRETKIATFNDAVHLVDQENNVTAEAQMIEYNQDKEIAVMQISVNIKQKDNTCTGAYALYRKKEQMLDLNGNPKVTQGSDTFRAQTISLNLDTQEISLDGRVSGSVTAKSSTEKQTEENTSTKPAKEEKKE